MLHHEERCSHCGGTFNAARPVVSGSKIGQMQRICSKCGHIKYELATPQPQAEHRPHEVPSTPSTVPKKWEWTY